MLPGRWCLRLPSRQRGRAPVVACAKALRVLVRSDEKVRGERVRGGARPRAELLTLDIALGAVERPAVALGQRHRLDFPGYRDSPHARSLEEIGSYGPYHDRRFV